jgi:hypothetical protein
MVPLPMVVRHELVEHVQQAPFPEENLLRGDVDVEPQ